MVTAGYPPMITYSSYLTFMCCVNLWAKIQVYCGNSGWPADDKIQQLSHIYVLCQHVREDTSLLLNSGWPANDNIQQLSHMYVLCQHVREYTMYCGNSGDPPMITYSSYLTFMCCVNMWGKIKVFCGNSGWPADDNIQQLSHIYVLCQHVREDTSFLWQQRVTHRW